MRRLILILAGIAACGVAGLSSAGAQTIYFGYGNPYYGERSYYDDRPRYYRRHYYGGPRYHRYGEAPRYRYRDPQVHYPSQRCPPGYDWLPAYGKCSSNFW